MDRVGTVRIERKEKEHIKHLTFAGVINVVEGQVLGGKNGLHKTLNKFVIGAMQLDAMMRYTEADSLLIVGNRVKAHRSEEHTSELQSRGHLVCRLLLQKKRK